MPINNNRQDFKCDGLVMFTSSESTIILDTYKVYPEMPNVGEHMFLRVSLELPIFKDPKILNYFENNLFINGIVIKKNSYQVDGYKYYAIKESSTHKNGIFTLYFNEFNVNLNFTFNIELVPGTLHKTEGAVSTQDEYVKVMTCYHINNATTPDIYTLHCNLIGDDNGSYMLMRTNPLLTGNIKLQYFESDTEKHAYLGTFRSNYVHSSIKNILALEIDLTRNYAYDVNQIFGDYSNDILCTLNNSFYTMDPKHIHTLFEEAYCDEYDYGVITNNLAAYPMAQMRLLAPLYIQNNIPDYFVIFRRPVLENDITDNIIENADVVKIIDLRSGTEFGDYLRRTAKACQPYAHNTYSQSNKLPVKFVNGIQPMTGVYTNNVSDNNATVNNDITTEGDMLLVYNALTSANVIHPNIINIEFLFDDPETPDFKIQNYYGLYMSEHNIQTIAHVLNGDKKSGINQISRYQAYSPLRKKIDIRDSILSVLYSPTVKDRVFCMSTDKDVRIIKNEVDFTSFVNQCVVNQPGKVIGHSFVQERNISNEMDSFITITFDREIHAGEHFRIISAKTQTGLRGQCDVYEFIASDDERLLRYNIPVGHYVQTNSINGINIYSIPFYVYKDEYKNEYAPLKDQIKYFAKAVAKMANFVNVYTISDNSIALYSTLHNLVFQHLAEPNYIGDIDYIHYYNPYHNTSLINVHTYDTFAYYAYNNPITEINSVRISSLAGFLNFSIFDNKYVYEISSDFDEILNGTIAPLYHAKGSKNYYSLNPINIQENTDLYIHIDNIGNIVNDKTAYTIISPFDTSKRIILTDEQIQLCNNQCTLYYTRVFNFSVMGIHAVKDIIADVYKPLTNQHFANIGSDIIVDSSSNHSFYRGVTSANKNKYTVYESYLDKNLLSKESLTTDSILHSSVSQLIILPDTVIDLKHLKEILKFVLYSISDKLLSNINIEKQSRVIFINDTELLYCSPNQTTMSYYDFSDSVLKTGNNAVIFTSLDTNIYDLDYTIMNSYAKYQWKYFIKNENKNTYNIPLIPNTAVLFQKTGLDKYYSHETRPTTVESDSNLLDKHYNVYTHMYNNSIDGYVKYSLNDIIEVDGKAMSVRDYITNGYSNAITSLYKKYLKTAQVYYDSNNYRAEFIYNDIYFTLLFSSEENRLDALFSYQDLEYYEAILVFDYDDNKNTEIFISSDERIILIVEHKAFKNNSQYRARYIKHNNSKSGQYESCNYYWQDAPYNYSFINSINTNDKTFILPKIKLSDETSNLNNVYSYVQTGYPLYKHIADFAETGYMCTIMPYTYPTVKQQTPKFDIISNNIWLSENITSNIPACDMVEQKSFYQYFLYASRYKENHPEYINIENEEDGLVYDMVDKSDQREYQSYIICNIKADDDSDTSYDNIDDTIIQNLNSSEYTIYFIQNHICEKFNITDSYQPCKLQASFTDNPDLFYTNRYELAAKDMFVFDKEDKELSKLTGIDFTFGNTHINSILKLRREFRSIYIGDDNGSPNINEYNGHVYSTLNVDIFMTPWNNQAAYTTCTNNSTNHSIIKTSMRLIAYWPKMYFGSYAYQLPETITCTVTTNHIRFAQYLTYPSKMPNMLNINYGKILSDYIKSLPEFKYAWNIKTSTIVQDDETSQNNFINRHILPYYIGYPEFEIEGTPIEINDTKLNNQRTTKTVTFDILNQTLLRELAMFTGELHYEKASVIDSSKAINKITIKYHRKRDQQ